MPRHDVFASARQSVALALSALALDGCVHYHARPISTQASLADIESRTLDSPQLRRFLQQQRDVEWPPAAWDFEALTRVAFFYHPDLDGARANWAATRAAIRTAGERPNPQISGGPGYNSSTPAGTITPWILTVALDLTVETAGKRGHRIAAARQLSEAARLKIATVAWEVRSRLRRTLLELHAASVTMSLVERQIGIQQDNVALLERQLAAGEISTFELTQARLALDSARFSLFDARSRRADAYVRLAAAMGVTPHALDGRTLSFASFEQMPMQLPEAEVRRRALLNRPDVLGALAEYEAAQAQLQLEVSRQYPDLHLGPGYQMDQADNKWTLGLAGLLPVLSRGRGPIAEAEAKRTQAGAHFVAVQSRAIEQIDAAVAGYEAARAKIEAADALLADLDKEHEVSERRWRAGDISRLELGLIEVEIATSEITRFEALVKAQQALGDVEDAIQTPANLPGWLAVPPRPPVPAAGATP